MKQIKQLLITLIILNAPIAFGCSPLQEHTKPIKQSAYAWGIATDQGDRTYMEDYPIVTQTDHGIIGAVFDGHAGHEAAEIAAENVPYYIQAELQKQPTNPSLSLQKALNITERCITTTTDSGTTAAVALLQGNQLHLAHTGDSRAIIVRTHHDMPYVFYATEDHKPENHEERKRIEEHKGSITFTPAKHPFHYITPEQKEAFEAANGHSPLEGIWRVNGLAMSRSLGDRRLKNMTPGGISAQPDIAQLTLKKGDVVLLASDGLWDEVTSEQAAILATKVIHRHAHSENVSPHLQSNSCKIMKSVAQALCDKTIALSDQRAIKADNISIVALHYMGDESCATATEQSLFDIQEEIDDCVARSHKASKAVKNLDAIEDSGKLMSDITRIKTEKEAIKKKARAAQLKIYETHAQYQPEQIDPLLDILDEVLS